ncbi:MAG TPA: M48 family metallopeptidase [Vicinamibacterales bacterium]|nr:M48 family metallopeptidase [Vicinamibacterales bacterium]
MNLLEQQASNRRRTWVIMGGFIVFLCFLGIGFDAFLGGGASMPVGTIAALGVGSVSALASYFTGDRAVLAATHAVPVGTLAPASEDERLKLRQLDNVVDEVAIAAGLPRPPVYVVPDADPNAFATGRGPGHASIAVTRGLLNALDRDELQGVIAHEMSHIRNYDVRLMTVVAALVGATALIADWSSRGLWWGGGRRRNRDDDGGGGGAAALVFFVIWLIAVMLAPLMAQLLAMMVSRRREYLADASGAELTRNPLGLARALEKIEDAVAPTQSINRGSAHLCIADPLGRRVNLKEGFWSDMFASHPPMAARIAALKAMAYAGH